jgi:hypothetical protein
MFKKLKDYFAALLFSDQILLNAQEEELSEEDEQTRNISKILEGAEGLGWKVAFIMGKDHEPEAIYAGSAEEILQFKNMMDFNIPDDGSGVTH